MKNFQPGGLRNRRDDIGGRPRGDVQSYAPKNRPDGDRPRFAQQFGEKRSTGFNPKDRAPRENKSYPAVCTTCGKSCDVPFRPDGSKPVLCRDCYSRKGPSTTNSDISPARFTNNELQGRKPAYEQKQTGVSSTELATIQKQLAAVEVKVSQILELINASQKLVEAIPEAIAVAPKISKVARVAKKEVVVEKKPVAKKVVAKKVVEKKEPAKKVVTKKVAVKKVAKK